MLYSKYSIECKFLENGTLSTFKGSALRGAFGYALKKATCTVHAKNCTNCILEKHCLYAKLFIENENKSATASVPYPYIIEPPQNKKRDYQAEEGFIFNLILLGEITDYLPFFIYAFEEMGRIGIGKNNSESRKHTPFKICQVHACHSDEKLPIYDADKKTLLSNPSPKNISYMPIVSNLSTEYELELNLETPLRFKSNNKIASSLDFLQLYKLISRRISTLFKEYGEKDFTFDYHALIEQVEKVKIVSSDLKWEEQQRYSQKQGESLRLGGLAGSIKYKGDMSQFIPLLDLATLLHLGKQSSFGLGKVSYTLKREI